MPLLIVNTYILVWPDVLNINEFELCQHTLSISCFQTRLTQLPPLEAVGTKCYQYVTYLCLSGAKCYQYVTYLRGIPVERFGTYGKVVV